MTTPAAAPAAPAAVAEDVVASAAAPAAAPATPVADSLIPEGDPVAPVEPAKDPAKPPEVKADEGPEWQLYDGVKGVGKMPDWYKADKYKTVADQAEAYVHLEKRLGAFSGAPKEGKYEAPAMPEGLQGEFVLDHPVAVKFTDWAKENQVSQKAYNEVFGMLAEYEASRAPDFEAAKREIGDDADKRITAVATWAKANMDAATFQTFRAAMGESNAASVFKAVEAIIAKTRQPALPKPGEIPGDAPVSPLADIQALQAKVGPDGKRLYETDATYRNMVEQKRMAYFKSLEAA